MTKGLSAQSPVEGYFDFCDSATNRNYGSYYTFFLHRWVMTAFPDFESYEQILVWFEHGCLSKITFINNQEVVKTVSRENFLNPLGNLDSKDTFEDTSHAEEFKNNESKFMQYILFSSTAIILSDSLFVLPISTA